MLLILSTCIDLHWRVYLWELVEWKENGILQSDLWSSKTTMKDFLYRSTEIGLHSHYFVLNLSFIFFLFNVRCSKLFHEKYITFNSYMLSLTFLFLPCVISWLATWQKEKANNTLDILFLIPFIYIKKIDSHEELKIKIKIVIRSL